jgi:hypothetical protein
VEGIIDARGSCCCSLFLIGLVGVDSIHDIECAYSIGLIEQRSMVTVVSANYLDHARRGCYHELVIYMVGDPGQLNDHVG